MRVVLVCSSGGHLIQLHQLKPWWEKHERTWVTFDLPDGRSLLEGEDVVWAYHPTTRNLRNAMRNLMLAIRMLPRYRPDVVVSDGAGVAFPFFVVARLLRIKTVYLEVYDRIDSATLTGRLCRPLSSLFLVQWEEQQRLYPGARRHRGALLNPDLPLVFVSVGTDFHPFDRLCRWVDAWLADGGERVARCFVQTGTSTPPVHADHGQYLGTRADGGDDARGRRRRLPRRAGHDHARRDDGQAPDRRPAPQGGAASTSTTTSTRSRGASPPTARSSSPSPSPTSAAI